MDPRVLVAKADKKAAPVSGLASLFSSSSYRYEEAAELYIQAANAYRLQKDGKSAGQTFEKAAASQQNCESKDMAADTLVEAYKSYKTTDPQDAARVLEQAVNLFTLRGQFRRAASYKADLGALYELELDDIPKAIQAYENSGDWYLQDQAESLASKSFLKVAELSALAEMYSNAVEFFEKVIKISMNNQLTKWSLKDHFLKASLCRLAEGDTVACERNLELYAQSDSGFVQTREYQLLLDVCAAVKDGNPDDFSSKVYEFDQFSKLDKWKTSLLLRIKNQMAAAEDDLL